jgi:hypothetical protein
MSSPRRFTVVAVSVLLLGAGVVLGFLPVRATLTQIAPELRLVTVSCGNGYLQATPPTQPGDLVALPGESGVYLPRGTYVEHCGEAAGWRRYAAWALTALGALGLAITFSAARTPVGPEPAGAGGSSPSLDIDPDDAEKLDADTRSDVGTDPGRRNGNGDRDGEADAEPAAEPARPTREEAGASRGGRHSRRDEPES